MIKVAAIISVFLFFVSCKENKTANIKKQNSKDYIDFKYDRVIAFATVNPMEHHETIYKRKIDLSKFHDTISKKLNARQVSRLNTILSGRENKNDDSSQHADCFYPRHNIVFIDRNNKVVNYILICFECNNVESSKPSSASMKNYEEFFDSLGLKVFYSPFEHSDYYDSIKTTRQQSISSN